MRRFSTKHPPEKGEIVVIFQTNGARPVQQRNPDGATIQATESFVAGERYTISEAHPYLRQWLADRVCYRADDAPPTAPAVMGAPINSTPIRTPADDQNTRRLIDAVLAHPVATAVLRKLGIDPAKATT